MRRIKVYVSTDKIGSKCTRVITVDDDESEDGLAEIAQDEMFNMINWGWEPVEETE